MLERRLIVRRQLPCGAWGLGLCYWLCHGRIIVAAQSTVGRENEADVSVMRKESGAEEQTVIDKPEAQARLRIGNKGSL